MASQDDEKHVAVPSGRLSRLTRFGGLASSIAGNVLVEGARSAAKGERRELRELLMTPGNAAKVGDQLSQLRGAAMKLGQILSMDAGDVVPPELAEMLAKLRDSAHSMPPQQLRRVLEDNWGRNWRQKFLRFDVAPIAAASIGQVHRAQTKDGRDVAIKIQYPGVRESIDSDVDNVATLIRLTGMAPKGVDLKPLLAQAKEQLHEEADYQREGQYLHRFGELLASYDEFCVPALHEDLTTKNILTMSYLPGTPIEALADAPQDERDRVMTHLIDLVLRELLDFRVMQTDPNFANYRYQVEGKKIVLLDFGAARDIPDDLAEGYRRLIIAGLDNHYDGMREAALDIGLFSAEKTTDDQLQLLIDIFDMAMEPVRHEGAFDFGATDMAMRMRDAGIKLRKDDRFTHVPPPQTLYFHRKFAGTYLLATRLKARVDVKNLLLPLVGRA